MASVLPLFLNAVRATARQYKGSIRSRCDACADPPPGFEMKNASSYFLFVPAGHSVAPDPADTCFLRRWPQSTSRSHFKARL